MNNQITIRELLDNVGQLSSYEFEEFFKKIQSLRLQKMPSDSINEEDKLLNAGNVILYFMEAVTMKRSKMPDDLEEKLKGYFR